MSRIDGGFNDAVTILFLVLYRSLILLEQDSTAMWSSLRKGSGAATRVLKEVDAVLSFIILVRVVKITRAAAVALTDHCLVA